MSPDATSDIVNAVRRARTTDDPGEVACSLVYAATNVIGDDDHVAKVFLARLMVKVAAQLDPDVVLSPYTQ
jgi:hypothetical protein